MSVGCHEAIIPVLGAPEKASQRTWVTELSFKDSFGIIQTEKRRKEGSSGRGRSMGTSPKQDRTGGEVLPE